MGEGAPDNPLTRASTVPFLNAKEAWLWAMNSAARGGVSRPCEPADVKRELDRLYRRRRIDLTHSRILRIWGERQAAPNPAYASERCDWRLWREAIDRLEWPLRVKGIVA